MRPDLQKRILRAVFIIRKLAAPPPPPASRTLAQELEAKLRECYRPDGALDMAKTGYLLRELNHLLPKCKSEETKTLVKKTMKRLLAGLGTGQIGVAAQFRKITRAMLEASS